MDQLKTGVAALLALAALSRAASVFDHDEQDSGVGFITGLGAVLGICGVCRAIMGLTS